TRNDDQRWQGSNWNMVFVGDTNAPQPSWPNPPFTVAATTPLVREKPYLTIDSANHYSVVVPPLKTNSQGTDWTTAGTSVSIDHFHIANPNVDTVATLNAALAQGKHLLFTPGVYHLNGTLRITQPGTIVLGLGLATLIADNGVALISIDDIDDATIAGLLLEAGPQSSNTLLEVGAPGSSLDHSANPTVLFDVHCRVGGAGVGTAASCVTINSNHVLGDNLWLWRADHGAGADWNTNKSDHGLIVNGHDVTIYGLFVEHFQKYQTLWNGDRGTVYFYQSEMPYDPPNQTAWQESAGKNGYPSYKVADGVQTHHAMGIGVYGVFNNDVTADNAIETPINAGTVLNHLVTVSLASGAIAHIINGTGGAVGHGTMTAFSGD
ncbi:MAG TPA: hypothetical protein VFF06_31865, partial [Polyangia bacterium]|nr:hypothetical protein [Polyangia bacterium]